MNLTLLNVQSTEISEVFLWQRAIYWTFNVIIMLVGVNIPVNYQGQPFSPKSLNLDGAFTTVIPFPPPQEWWIVCF